MSLSPLPQEGCLFFPELFLKDVGKKRMHLRIDDGSDGSGLSAGTDFHTYRFVHTGFENLVN